MIPGIDTIATDAPDFGAALARWASASGLDANRLLDAAELRLACRGPASAARLDDWERRHGYRLPRGLRAWLLISNGLHGGSPIIHPIEAIGPMVAFAHVPGLIVQPESWFELGNPTESETVCVDLAYRWPGGDFPIFASGDDQVGSAPRLIAASFDEWFIGFVEAGGRPYWLDDGHAGLGDPWEEHRRRTPAPRLASRLSRLIAIATPLVGPGRDERVLARELDISRSDAEALIRFLQHARPASEWSLITPPSHAD